MAKKTSKTQKITKKKFTSQDMAKLMESMSAEEKLALRAIKKNKEGILDSSFSDSDDHFEDFLEE